MMLGVKGWDDQRWGREFYPEGMPEAWRLTYFNTQFACLYLQSADWQAASVDRMRGWAEDTHAQFRFLLEGAGDQPVPEPLAGRAVVMREHDPAIAWFDRRTGLRDLTARLGAEPSVKYVLSRDADLGQIERVRTLLELLA